MTKRNLALLTTLLVAGPTLFAAIVVGRIALLRLSAMPPHEAKIAAWSDENLRLDAVGDGSRIGNPTTLTGWTRGTMFFEASFPVKVLDADGNELGTAIAQAQDDWMTEDFVPFSVTLAYPPPATPTGFLAFTRDNPSGLPEHDLTITVPIVFQSVQDGN